jgi:hypothetical protein
MPNQAEFFYSKKLTCPICGNEMDGYGLYTAPPMAYYTHSGCDLGITTLPELSGKSHNINKLYVHLDFNPILFYYHGYLADPELFLESVRQIDCKPYGSYKPPVMTRLPKMKSREIEPLLEYFKDQIIEKAYVITQSMIFA